MTAMAYMLQSNQGFGWIWWVLLAILLVVVIWWLFGRRTGEQGVESPPSLAQIEEARTPDDLTKLEGIGPKVARVLNDAGIVTFEALSRTNPADIQKALNAAGLQMMNPQGWIEQASLAARGDWQALEKLQGELKGGRKK
jgi:hypothetical protein